MRSAPRFRRLRWALGFAVAVGGLLLAGELYLRHFPPRELHQYLGEESPLTGPFKPDPVFMAQYRDWDAFAEDYKEPLAKYLPFGPPGRPAAGWAMFGNSFVQAPGMLADTARAEMPGFPVFNLGRNEPVPVRLAQIDLLLANGLKPERLVVALLPIDVVTFHWHAVDQFHVTRRGALTYRPRDPGGVAGWWVANSRLALSAWVRTEMHHAHPHYRRDRVMRGVSADVLADFDRLFAALARTAGRHGVPVTVLLIPNYDQVVRGASFGLQDQLAETFRGRGLDVCDARAGFLAADDKPGLFIPDKHYSARGNRILLAALRRHLAPGDGGPK